MEIPGGLQSMGLQRTKHDLAIEFTCTLSKGKYDGQLRFAGEQSDASLETGIFSIHTADSSEDVCTYTYILL